MNLSKDEKKQILKTFIEVFERIADKSYQMRIWIQGQGPECDDFDETVNYLFLEGDNIVECYNYFGIKENQHSLLKNFLVAFKRFSRTIGRERIPEDFIDSPEWTEITKMAKEVLKAFNWDSTKKTIQK
jgi:hypothetical protein